MASTSGLTALPESARAGRGPFWNAVRESAGHPAFQDCRRYSPAPSDSPHLCPVTTRPVSAFLPRIPISNRLAQARRG